MKFPSKYLMKNHVNCTLKAMHIYDTYVHTHSLCEILTISPDYREMPKHNQPQHIPPCHSPFESKLSFQTLVSSLAVDIWSQT